MSERPVLDARDRRDGATLRVRVTPRAGKDAIAGARAGALLVRVIAPARDGAANDAVVRLLARAAGVAPSAVEILQGATGPEKVLRFEGVAAADLVGRLASRTA